MPGQNVTITMTADDRDVLRAFQKQQAEILRNQKALLRTGQAGGRAGQKTATAFQKVRGTLSNILPVLGAGAGIVGLLHMWISANREIIRQSGQIGDKLDENRRKLLVQSGLRGLQADAAQERVERIAQEVPVGEDAVTTAQQAATQLVSSGFSAEQATGPALREFLKIMAASNLFGRDVDAKGLAKSAASFLASQGMEQNAENLRLVGRGIQALFKGTNIQLSDLQQFSKQAATFKGALDVPEQFGAFSQLVQAVPAEEATTGFRNFVLRLQTAAKDRGKVDALEQIGLSPEDVDFVGENLDDIIGKLQTGLKQLPERKRQPVLATIFGERTVSPARILIQQREAIQEAIRLQQDTAQFERDLALATSGRVAGGKRLEAQRQLRLEEHDQFDDLISKAIEVVGHERDRTAFEISAAQRLFSTMRGVGFGPEAALQLSVGEDESVDEILERVRQSRGAFTREQIRRLVERLPDQQEKFVRQQVRRLTPEETGVAGVEGAQLAGGLRAQADQFQGERADALQSLADLIADALVEQRRQFVGTDGAAAGPAREDAAERSPTDGETARAVREESEKRSRENRELKESIDRNNQLLEENNEIQRDTRRAASAAGARAAHSERRRAAP